MIRELADSSVVDERILEYLFESSMIVVDDARCWPLVLVFCVRIIMKTSFVTIRMFAKVAEGRGPNAASVSAKVGQCRALTDLLRAEGIRGCRFHGANERAASLSIFANRLNILKCIF